MTAFDWLADHIGDWTGTNRFRFLPDEAYTESPSRAHVSLKAHGHVALIEHTWVTEGEDHEGLLVLGAAPDDGTFQSTWTESWHQQPHWLASTGRLSAPHTLQLEGSYGPGAGWNIRVEAEHPASFRLVMDHVYPPHGAYPVVIAEYHRP
jgi:Protein of unknown function (DUF1579)